MPTTFLDSCLLNDLSYSTNGKTYFFMIFPGHAQSPAYPMYNSPMNSISSPQQSSNNQVAPPSPLDVSVPRPSSQTGSIAYPSVITRALNPEKILLSDMTGQITIINKINSRPIVGMIGSRLKGSFKTSKLQIINPIPVITLIVLK